MASHPDLPDSYIHVEICVEDIDGVRTAARNGADRAELCDNLAAGGTTPSIGAIEAALIAAAEQVEARRNGLTDDIHGQPCCTSTAPFGLHIMVRPRGGSFVYSHDEGRAMIADMRRIASLAQEMSDYTQPRRVAGSTAPLPPLVQLGFVTGALTEAGTIDRGLFMLLMDMAGDAPVTFHKAIDATADIDATYAQLGSLGVSYVLSSGQADKALHGVDTLARLVQADGPQVIAAGGIRPGSIGDLVRATGVRQIHMRAPQAGAAAAEGRTSAELENGLWLAPHRTDADLVAQSVACARTWASA